MPNVGSVGVHHVDVAVRLCIARMQRGLVLETAASTRKSEPLAAPVVFAGGAIDDLTAIGRPTRKADVGGAVGEKFQTRAIAVHDGDVSRRGVAEWLAGNDEPAKWLRQNAEVVFVPIMDVDHVTTGDGGKHALPQDHNRDWSDSPHWPEVAAAQKRILAAVKEGRLAVFLDVHDPAPTATLPMFYRDYPPYVSEQQAALEDRFLTFAREIYGEIKVVDGKPSKPEDLPVWHRISTPWALEHGNPQTISFTVEIPWNTPSSTPAGYRVVGQKLGQTVEKLLHDGR